MRTGGLRQCGQAGAAPARDAEEDDGRMGPGAIQEERKIHGLAGGSMYAGDVQNGLAVVDEEL